MEHCHYSWTSLYNFSSCLGVRHLAGWKVLFFAVSAMSLLTTTLYLLYTWEDQNKRTTHVIRNNFTLPKLLLVPKLQRRLWLLILVPSAPTNFDQRNAIRKTWGDAERYKTSHKYLNENNWQIVFVVGKKNDYLDAEIASEARKNDDILMGKFQDSYDNLVVKTLTSFSWAAAAVNCTYVLKADDDVYVHVPRLIQWLSNPQLPLRLYAGQVHSSASPVRRTNSKYYVSEETFSGHRYPPYCGGPFYILSSNILGDMLRAARYFKLLTIEDAYMGILAGSLGVTPVHIREFRFYFPFSETDFEEFSVCDFASFLAVGHQMSTTLIQNVHIKLKALESLNVDAGCHWNKFYLPGILCSLSYSLFVTLYVIYKRCIQS